MKEILALAAAVILALATCAQAARTPDQFAEEREELQKRIDLLVKQLGDKDYNTREAATKALMDIGRAALDAVKKAAESDDPEVKLRAAKILSTIRLGIGSDWPPDIAIICRHFERMSADEQMAGLKKVVEWGKGRTIPFLVTVLRGHEADAVGREAFGALSNLIEEDENSAQNALSSLEEPETQLECRLAALALKRLGKPVEAIDVLASVKHGEVSKEEFTRQFVDVAKDLLAKEDYKTLADLLKKHKERLPPDDTRMMYLEAEAIEHAIDGGEKARALRQQALAADIRPGQRFMTADMLENINRPHLASLEWHKVLDMPGAEDVYKVNAYMRLGSIFARIGFPHEGADYLEKGLLAYRKAKEGGGGMGITGATEEEIEAHIAALRKREPGKVKTAVEIKILFKNSRDDEYKKVRKESNFRVRLGVQPHGLRIFDVTNMNVSYAPETHKLHILMNGSDVVDPVVVAEVEKPITFILAQLDCEYLFSLDPNTGEVKRLSRFEKDYIIYVRPMDKFRDAADFRVSINGQDYDATEACRGIPFDFLPEKMEFVIKAKGADGKEISHTINLPSEEIDKHQ